MTGSPRTAPLVLLHRPSASFPSTAFAKVVLAMLYLRWLAGIADNFGAAALSESVAVVFIAVLGVALVARMSVVAETTLFLAGILAWAFSGLLSLVVNPVPAPQDSVALLALLLLYGLFANACFSHLRRPQLFASIRRFLVAFILFGALLAGVQIVTETGFIAAGKDAMQRAYGSDVHPVSFAIQIVAATVALEIIRAKTAARLSVGHVLIVLAGLAALYLTFARTAWMMAAITVGYVLMLRGNGAMRLFFLAVIVPVLVAVSVRSDRFSDLGSLAFFWSTFSLENMVFDFRYVDNSVSWRIVNWGYGLQQAMEQPVFGFGPGQSASASYFHL